MSQYLFTNYYHFRLNEAAIVTDKQSSLKMKMDGLKQKLSIEKDPALRRRYEMEIKVCELKLMIAQIK